MEISFLFVQLGPSLLLPRRRALPLRSSPRENKLKTVPALVNKTLAGIPPIYAPVYAFSRQRGGGGLSRRSIYSPSLYRVGLELDIPLYSWKMIGGIVHLETVPLSFFKMEILR